ncbi:hypothetical protein CDL15_Pgr000487 [Punica granatum]|uniref:Uncharacterized protein n=1 Tax=Punica granatum TaxID=22663 RepID=A0A218W2P1_PUNGR|nr:hypothetical protein CDL15_Pgr000487 [Punica granatum]
MNLRTEEAEAKAIHGKRGHASTAEISLQCNQVHRTPLRIAPKQSEALARLVIILFEDVNSLFKVEVQLSEADVGFNLRGPRSAW